MTKRGFILTLDAVAALAFLLVVVIFVATATFRPAAPRGTYLKQVSQDLLTVLEKDGSLNLLVHGNSTPARRTLLAAPESVCIATSIITPEGQTITMISRPDCGLFKYEFQMASIAFDDDGEPYLASAESWYKRVED